MTPPPAKILLVDDTPNNLLVLRALLDDLGHDLVTAGSGPEALRLLFDTDFALVLMDVQMPGMDGFEATARLREVQAEVGHRTPVLALTAHAMKGDRERCLAAGMDGYVTKPIQPAELLSAVLGLTGRRATAAA